MKKEKLFLASIVLLGALAFTSCEKEEVDNEKPLIDLIAPEEDEAFQPGSDIHFEVEFSDNVALASYKVNIHGAFDGHTHSVVSTRAEEDAVEFEKTWMESDFIALGEEPISGKRSVTVHHHEIEIPATINEGGIAKPIKEGHYHFTVYCTDEAGLESSVTREIVISSDAEEHDDH
jgi:hypothetical protein